MMERISSHRREPDGRRYTEEELNLVSDLAKRAVKLYIESDKITYREAVDIAAAEMGKI